MHVHVHVAEHVSVRRWVSKSARRQTHFNVARNTFGLGEEVQRNLVATCRGDFLCWAAHRLRVQGLHAC